MKTEETTRKIFCCCYDHTTCPSPVKTQSEQMNSSRVPTPCSLNMPVTWLPFNLSWYERELWISTTGQGRKHFLDQGRTGNALHKCLSLAWGKFFVFYGREYGDHCRDRLQSEAQRCIWRWRTCIWITPSSPMCLGTRVHQVGALSTDREVICLLLTVRAMGDNV